MTVGVALKCENAVVLACDSQGTGGNYKAPMTKLVQLDAYRGLLLSDMASIGREVADALVPQLKEGAHTTPDVAERAADIMASVYSKLAKRHEAQVPQLADAYPAALLIGGYEKGSGQPQIYTVFSPGIATPVENFDAIGSGRVYAAPIVSREFFSPMNQERAQFLAVRAVMEACELDPYVGGAIRLALIRGGDKGYKERTDYVETEFRPKLKEIAALRRSLDDLLLTPGTKNEDQLAILLDKLGVFGIGDDAFVRLSGKAYASRDKK